jgi:hypothetical protein
MATTNTGLKGRKGIFRMMGAEASMCGNEIERMKIIKKGHVFLEPNRMRNF